MERCNWCRERLDKCSCGGGSLPQAMDEPDHGEFIENYAFEGSDEYYGCHDSGDF